MTPKELTQSLMKAIPAGLPILIVGQPGCGKTSVVEQVCESLGYDLFISHPAVADPTDYKGQPCIVDGLAEFLPYGDLRQLMETEEPTVCFLDDLGQASQSVQKALMQLVGGRQVNGKKISDTVVFMAATNRREDRAGVNGILEPLKSRFKSIFHLDICVPDWIEWALENKTHMGVIGWIHYNPGMLSSWKPTADIVNGGCPRTVVAASDLIKADLDSFEHLKGAVGEVEGASLKGFLQVYNNLPDLDEILEHPESTDVPQEPSALYATAVALVEKANKKNMKAIVTYARRFPRQMADVAVFMVDSIRKSKPKIQNTAAYIDWVTDHSDMYFN